MLSRSLSELDVLDMAMKRKQQKQATLEAEAALEADAALAPAPYGAEQRYLPEPPCAEGCRDCERGSVEEVIASENVEWARIAYGMKKPKWVFDGRGIVEVAEMEKLGFRVEAIGRAGSRSRLHGMLPYSFSAIFSSLMAMDVQALMHKLLLTSSS
jgi:UDPglucose 6-dehydrogenase